MGGKSAKRVQARGWQPLVECSTIRRGDGAILPVPDGERVFGNDLYTAVLRRQEPVTRCGVCNGDGWVLASTDPESDERKDCAACDGSGDVTDESKPIRLHISYHRRDRKPARDWRNTQRIKNDIVGPEQEMVELYPAESRMVDLANEYHLWGLEGIALAAFGWNDGRQVQGSAEAAALPGAQQRDGATI